MKKRNNMIRVIAGFMVTLLLSNTGGQLQKLYANDEVPKTKVAITKESMQDFLDTYFSANMDKYHVHGVAVSVVKGKEELLHAEYGVSDKEKNIPVEADKTLFPACSVSKLFTATAIMQLEEEGKLDLNEDITNYVGDIKISNPLQETITCRELLTHTGGLDEQSELNGSTLQMDNIKSQKDYFKTHIPTVIRKPGTMSCYSNMGYNLLGYIVEQQSGETYENYVTEHLLNPLQMTSASVRIPQGTMATGYEYNGEDYEKQPFAYQYTSGSSGIIASVTDMENYMEMQLNEGLFENTKVLNSETVIKMQKRQFANNPVFEGMGYGFVRDRINGVLVLKHEGALPGYATTMLLLPDEQIGIYVATNSLSGICFDFEEAFFDYFYSKEEMRQKINDAAEDDLESYVGTYRSYDGIAQTNLMKIGILMETSDLKISKDKSGQLKMEGYNQKKEKEETLLLPYQKDVFLRQDQKGYIAFSRNESDGQISCAYTNVSHVGFEKVAWFESKSILLGGLFLAFLMTMIFGISLLCQGKKETVLSQKIMYVLAGTGEILSTVGSVAGILIAIKMIMSYDYSREWLMRLLLGMGNFASVVVIIPELVLLFQKGGKRKKTIGIFLLFQLLLVWNLYYFHI